MIFIKKLFKRKKTKNQEAYAYMGSLGVSLGHMKMYQESISKIKEFEKKLIRD
jgi:hypothetical protein